MLQLGHSERSEGPPEKFLARYALTDREPTAEFARFLAALGMTRKVRYSYTVILSVTDDRIIAFSKSVSEYH